MKSFFPLIIICVLVASCSQKKEEASADTESQKTLPKLTGIWIVKKFVFSDISAMNDSTANEWVGKKVLFGKDVVFQFSQIPSYKTIFTSDTVCKNFEVLVDTLMTQEYISQYNISPGKLGNIGNAIRTYKTNSPETPFEELFILNDKELIMMWDGTFFFLNAE